MFKIGMLTGPEKKFPVPGKKISRSGEFREVSKFIISIAAKHH